MLLLYDKTYRATTFATQRSVWAVCDVQPFLYSPFKGYQIDITFSLLCRDHKITTVANGTHVHQWKHIFNLLIGHVFI